MCSLLYPELNYLPSRSVFRVLTAHVFIVWPFHVIHIEFSAFPCSCGSKKNTQHLDECPAFCFKRKLYSTPLLVMSHNLFKLQCFTVTSLYPVSFFCLWDLGFGCVHTRIWLLFLWCLWTTQLDNWSSEIKTLAFWTVFLDYILHLYRHSQKDTVNSHPSMWLCILLTYQ